MKSIALIIGIVFSALTSFSQQTGTFTDPRDGKVYKTVKIGEQLIMAENLAFKPITNGYWAYNNDTSTVAKYGYLYDWETAKTIAPAGWHLPTKEEWMQLHKDLGGNSEKVFEAMKEGGSSGFNILFPGWRAKNDKFYPEGLHAYFWSCDGQDREHAFLMYCKSSGDAKLGTGVTSFGFSVRLFANKEENLKDDDVKLIRSKKATTSDSTALNKSKTLTTIYARTYFEVRFMSISGIVFEVLTPTLGAVAYQNNAKGYVDYQNSMNQTKDEIVEANKRKNSNEFEKKMGDFSVLSYFANTFSVYKDSIDKYNLLITTDKSENTKIVDRLCTGKIKDLDPTFTNELNSSDTKYVSAFKFQYGIGARAGMEQFGMTKTYRPFVRLVGYIKDVSSNIIVWQNSIIVFSTKEFHGRNEAEYANEEELKKEFKKLCTKLVKITINDINGTPFTSKEQLVDISPNDTYLK